MPKHRAPRFVRTKEIVVGIPVVAGVSAVTLGALAFPAQAHTTTAAPPAVVAAPAAAQVAQYTVQPGDTVARIAAAHGQPWQAFYQRNVGVIGSNPNVITPGQVLAVSGTGAPAPAAAPAPAPAAAPAPAPAAAPAPVQALVAAAQSPVASITNNAGPVQPRAAAAANAVVSNVPGAAGITIGGTRPSAADPGGHPSGLALDYMVLSDTALGDAIVQYHVANWDALGVEYIIWHQRMLSSPTGSWSPMADRGSATANHMDHPHVNYQAG
ncbi:LysM domain-containing protein [Modestobacter sp. VKM Ac-2977]|uniref:LysM peptidoglycan-binding domain-containing protein n=1 Tax=Modestobacter sp. VKM Ac-2977 TaxID=3004131 RepID=UPI0022AA25DC|nr:LysM domain-containing protein [Modestobacter sp. VKM Ac-2977]MCZ2820252.1 LysM domain-containing protein [Modestobacter sp. VKM Ac-2977]